MAVQARMSSRFVFVEPRKQENSRMTFPMSLARATDQSIDRLRELCRLLRYDPEMYAQASKESWNCGHSEKL